MGKYCNDQAINNVVSMVRSNVAEVLPVQPKSRKKSNLVIHRRIVGKSASIGKVFSLIERVCDTDSTVLIQGESGTGKELIAQALHYSGDRAEKPFVPVNCGAIPAELLESELFGHEKGAFTHAIRTRIGRFELADRGTVFLDEIAEMSPVLQVKLLRVLQEKRFERVGGTKTITSDFRVIAATNQDLEEAVKKGTFREDLYYRLTVIPITSPPLRERTGDIPLLVDTFLKRFCLSKKRDLKGVSPEAMAKLKSYDWPGNVRELENMVERMVILAMGDEITLEDLPPRIYDASPKNETPAVTEIPETGFCLSKVIAEYEKKLIIRALEQTGWVKNRAAKLIQVNRTTLLEKMKRHGVSKPA
jgi:DNA-binding NtrC family response regulator